MTQRGSGWAGFALAALVGVAACQERLTEPASCPALCPGGSAEVFDTVLTPVPATDSSFAGYVEAGSGAALLVSNGLPASESRAVYRFGPRPDSIVVGPPGDTDTVRYVVDSVLVAINMLARDTMVNGLKVYVYRIANTVESGVTFADVQAQLVEANLIDSIPVADTLRAGQIQFVLRGPDVLKTGLPVDSGGTLAIGLALAAEQPTGIRVGSTAGATGATFASYVTAQNVDDTVTGRKQTINRTPTFNTFVSAATLQPEPDLLTVGGEPSSRAILRFDLPPRLEDSASIVRATLELDPARPILGLRGDSSALAVKAVLADLGAKSPLASEDFWAVATVPPDIASTVSVDVTNIVRLWQAQADDRPDAVFLSLEPEAASFMRAEFGSTRSPGVSGPRLRLTYMVAFPFENP